MMTIRLFAVMNMGLFGFILLAIHFIPKPSNRVQVMGWICVTVSVSVFAAPLSILVSIYSVLQINLNPSLSFWCFQYWVSCSKWKLLCTHLFSAVLFSKLSHHDNISSPNH